MKIERFFCCDPSGVQDVHRDHDENGTCCRFEDVQEAVRQACDNAEHLDDLRASLGKMFGPDTATYRVEYYYLASGMDSQKEYVVGHFSANSPSEAIELALKAELARLNVPPSDDYTSRFLRTCLKAIAL